MSTSLLYHGWSFKGYRYVRSHFVSGRIIFTVQQDHRSLKCPTCHSVDVLSQGCSWRLWRTYMLWFGHLVKNCIVLLWMWCFPRYKKWSQSQVLYFDILKSILSKIKKSRLKTPGFSSRHLTNL